MLNPIRVIIASPSDVKEEREALDKIISRLNRNTAESLGLVLKAIRWETDSYPGFHVDGPQGLIDPILKIEDCDILICIFWKRFGTPIKEDGKTGTEHEFYKAYEAWKQNKKPHIMMYFNQKEYFPRNAEEAKQLTYILDFKENLPKEGLSWNYDGIEQFKEFIYDHLTNYLQNIFDIQPSIAESEKPEKKESKKLLKPFSGEKPVFIGRTEYIDNKIKNLLKEPGSHVSIVGIGGSGKSQLAFKALHKYYEKDAIIDLIVPVYLSAIASTTSTEEKNDGKNELTVLTFRRLLDEIGSELIKQGILQISEQDLEQLDTEKCKSLIYNALATKKRHPILYCDNFETLSNELEERKGDKNIKEIFNFLNNELPSNTSILITSRNVKNFLSKENRIDLEGLKIEESLKVFIEHASTYLQHFSDPENKKIELLKIIVTKTGGHPLSIEILAKTYEGGGETELQNMSATLGKQRDNPWGSEERHENLYKCFNYSIERLDESLKMLLPKTTILHSPFPSEAVEKIFGIQESGLLVALYNKSLLSRMERDEYGSFNDKFWLYSHHRALRNYLEDKYKDLILKIETESVTYFYNYYHHLVNNTHSAWGKENNKDFIRQFVQMTKSENNDYDRAIEFAVNINIQGNEEKLGKQIGGNIATYLGLIHRNLGFYDRSLLYHKKALEIDEALGDKVGMARNYNSMGVVYYEKGQLDDALQYYNKALEIQEALGDRVGMARDYANMGLLYNNKGQLDEALQYHKNALEIDEALGDKVGMARDYANMGLVYYDKGQLDEALQYHKNALEIHEALGDKVVMAKDYNNMGLVYYTKGQLDEALQYYKEALEIDEALGDKVGMAIDYNNMGLVYYEKGQLDEALQYYNKALEIHEALGDKVGMAGVYANMGELYRNKGQLDDSLQYHKKALEIHQGLGDILNLVEDYCNIGYAHLAKNDKNEATVAANNALKIVKEFEDKTGNKHLFAEKVEGLVSSLK